MKFKSALELLHNLIFSSKASYVKCLLIPLLCFLISFSFLCATLLDPPTYSQRNFAIFENAIEELKIGGYLDVDGRLFLGKNPFKSTFFINKARFFVTGKTYDTVGFMLMPSWDQDEVTLHYSWIETLHPNWAQIRIGLFNKPFSLEALTSFLYLNFVERSMAIRNYSRSDDIGMMVYGKLPDYHLVYAIGVFNGRGKRLDNNNNKELVGRLTYHAIRSPVFGRAYLGMSAATGKQNEDLSQTEFITEANTPFWKWKKKVKVRDTLVRYGMDLQWLVGSFGCCCEYIYTNWGNIHKGDHHVPFEGHGGYADVTYLITGESKSRNAPVIPKHNFNPCGGGLGAWELAARYELFYGSKKMIDLHFAKGANFLHGPIFGINWYLNPVAVARLDAQYIWFNRSFRIKSQKIDHEIYLIGRFQIVF